MMSMLELPLRCQMMERLITSLLLGVMSQMVQGCSLFRLNGGEKSADVAAGVISRFEVVVPEVSVAVRWAGGNWLSQNEVFLAGLAVSAVLVVAGLAVSRLARR